MKQLKIKVLLNLPGYNAGQTVFVSVDKEGTPLERFWRRRFKEAETDNCCEIVTEKESPKGSQATKTKRGKD